MALRPKIVYKRVTLNNILRNSDKISTLLLVFQESCNTYAIYKPTPPKIDGDGSTYWRRIRGSRYARTGEDGVPAPIRSELATCHDNFFNKTVIWDWAMHNHRPCY